MSNLAERLRSVLHTRDLSIRALASLAHMSEGGVRAILRENADSATLRTVHNIADALGVSEAWLAFGIGESHDIPRGNSVPIVGSVAAGAWVASSDLVDEPVHNRSLSPDLRFDRSCQYGLSVQGDSMNLLFASGDDLLCLDYRRLRNGPVPQHNDIVIVEQISVNGAYREVSAKRLLIEDNRQKLVAQSSVPKWKDFTLAPTADPQEDEPIVSICAIVLRSERGWYHH